MTSPESTPPQSSSWGRGAWIEGDVLENARVAVEQDPVRLWLESDERRHSLAMLKALRLAPTLEVMEALLRGEDVPKSRLDPEWAKAYGIA